MRIKFNSQVCTTKEQSQRLLELGLKPETADMSYYKEESCLPPYEEMECPYDNMVFPAWSLHRLILLCPNTGVLTITKGAVEYEGLTNYQVEEEDGFFSKQGDDIYGNLLDCIEWLIKKGYFPKEHLVSYKKKLWKKNNTNKACSDYF